MAFQPVENVAEVTLQFCRGTDPASADWTVVNVHHWRRALGWNQTALDSLVTEVQAWWDSDLKALTAADLRLYDITARDIGDEFGLESYLLVDEVGTNAGAGGIVAMTSAVVQWTCDSGTAPRRGTTYFGGLTEANILQDAVESTFRTNLAGAYDALRAIDVVSSAALVIVSRFQGYTLFEKPNGTVVKKPTPRDPALSNTIASVDVRGVVGVQKRRRRN